MSTYEDRLTALERTSVSRTELVEAMNKLERQQGQTLRDRSHETTISLGVLADDVRVLKENVRAVRIRVDEGFSDLSRELYSMEEKFTKRFVSLEDHFVSLEKRLDGVDQRFIALEEKFDQRFTSLEGKFEQLLQILAPPKTDQ